MARETILISSEESDHRTTSDDASDVVHMGVTAIAVMTTPLATMTLMIVLMEMEMWTTILSWHYGVKFYMAGQILNEP